MPLLRSWVGPSALNMALLTELRFAVETAYAFCLLKMFTAVLSYSGKGSTEQLSLLFGRGKLL